MKKTSDKPPMYGMTVSQWAELNAILDAKDARKMPSQKIGKTYLQDVFLAAVRSSGRVIINCMRREKP